MSKSLKDAESLHTDQHDANVISPIVNVSDKTAKKMAKAGDNSYDEPAKKENKRHKSRKRKINSPSSSPEIVKCSNKKRQKKSRSRQGKGKGRLPHTIFIQFIIKFVY